MRILFLSYWGVQEGLTSATVIPHLDILSGNDRVEKIIFCSIERNSSLSPVSIGKKVLHVPLLSQPRGSVFITKFNDFYTFPRQLKALCLEHRIDLIVCRSSLAGALGYLVKRKTSIPYIVESFEPHADYMIDSHVWKSYDPRSILQNFFEQRIKATAKFILPVSQNYLTKLLEEGIEAAKMYLLPCCIQLDRYAFDSERRDKIRSQLGVENGTVGIYVGKFGGIYYEKEAFQLYAAAFRFFGADFFLILLTGDPVDKIKRYISTFGLPEERIFIKFAAPSEVPAYLCAADFAFSTIKPAPSRPFCSPIKDGEYWANGLPILLEPGIGDDSDIIQTEGGGIILDMQQPEKAFREWKERYSDRQKSATSIQKIAQKHRGLDRVKKVYDDILKKL